MVKKDAPQPEATEKSTKPIEEVKEKSEEENFKEMEEEVHRALESCARLKVEK